MAYLDPPEYMPDPIAWLRQMTRVVKGIMQGKTNNVGSVTLTPNSTTTVVTLADGQLGSDTHVSLTATTASAKTSAGLGMSVSKDIENKRFTITHDNTANTDKIFTYALIG